MKLLIATLLVAVITAYTQIIEQKTREALTKEKSASFNIYVINGRFGPETVEYFRNHNFKFATLQTQGAIVRRNDKSAIDLSRVERFLNKRFPNADTTGMLVLDLESEPFKDLRDYDATDSRFKAAEKQWLTLVEKVKRLRPELKVGVYGIPFRSYYDWQKKKYNQPGKMNNLLSEVDFIAPSLYIMYSDEKVGHNRNIRYLKENLDVALTYGKELGKPVIPFIWHRVHYSDDVKGQVLIDKEVFADYVNYIASYSRDNYKVNGVLWWDYSNSSSKIKNMKGVDSFSFYDSITVDYARKIVGELNY